MIIQVRGTSGSGKSTVVREVMERTGDWVEVFTKGRKAPIAYAHSSEPILVLGQYNRKCGGGDTIGSARKIYNLLHNLNHYLGVNHYVGEDYAKHIVLLEGLLMSEDTKWTLTFPTSSTKIVYLTTPIQECLRRINQRRAEAGRMTEVNPTKSSSRVEVINRSRIKLELAGVHCVRNSSDQAPGTIMTWINNELAHDL